MTTTDPVFRRIPLTQLHRSPTQPRLVYPEAYIAALAADIKHHGRNLQPLLVRPRVPELFKGTGDPNAVAGFEVVFGSCRELACGIAGVTEPWCEVRDMSDTEAEQAQISENLQRKDVHPFEEAQSYQSLIDRHNDTADAIAARTGKSRSYVYGRLKLLQACAEVRDACLKGDIGAETALLIARLRHPKLQQQALGYIKGKSLDLKDGGKESYRRIKDLLNERFTLDLSKAPFPLELALPDAGDCADCPKRSANAPEYQDVVEGTKSRYWSHQNIGPDVCTDPNCFAAKKATHFKNQADAMRGDGKTVIDGNRARSLVGADGKVKGGYVPLGEVRAQLSERKKLIKQGKAMLCPAVVTIQDPRDGKTYEAVKESELVELNMRDPAPAKGAKAPQRDHEAEQQERDAKATALTTRNMNWLQRVRAAARSAERSTFDLRLTLGMLLEWLDDNDAGETLEQLHGCSLQALDGQLEKMTANELGLLLLDCVMVEGVAVDSWSLDEEPKALLAAAAHYGVDLAEPASTPSLAARASKGTAAKGKKKTAAGDAAVDVDQDTSQAGSAGKEKGGADGAEAGQVEQEGAPA